MPDLIAYSKMERNKTIDYRLYDKDVVFKMAIRTWLFLKFLYLF